MKTITKSKTINKIFFDDMKRSFKQANYKYIVCLGNGDHLVKDLDTKQHEIFVANKNFHGWGLKWKNSDLEFVRELNYNWRNEWDDFIFRNFINVK